MKRAAILATRMLVALYAGPCGVLFLARRSLLFHPVPALGGVTSTLDVPPVETADRHASARRRGGHGWPRRRQA